MNTRPVTEGLHPDAQFLDMLLTEDFVSFMMRDHEQAFAAVRDAAVPLNAAVNLVIKNCIAGGRLIYVGAGTSGRLGLMDAAEFPPTFSMSGVVDAVLAGGINAFIHSVEGAEDDEDKARKQMQLRNLTTHDVVCGIAASGTTPFTCAAVKYARDAGAHTVFITSGHLPVDVKGHTLAEVTVRLDTGPEIVSGSTRLKAGTAQKIVLNIISTALGSALGQLYGGIMVGVRVTNAKLKRRAEHNTALLTGLPLEQAAALLERANNETKVAVVMHYKKLARAEAETFLNSHDGRLRSAIGTIEYIKKVH